MRRARFNSSMMDSRMLKAGQYAEQKAENVRLNSLLDSIRKIMTNMKMGAEQA